MKKHLLLALVCLLSLGLNAIDNGHFALNVQDQQLAVSELPAQLNSLFNLSSDYTFELVRDETDGIGMQHLSYQQFYKGIKVDGAMVLAHGKDGKINFLNGELMQLNSQPKSIQQKVSKRKIAAKYDQNEDDTDFLIIPITQEDGSVTYHPAYKVYNLTDFYDYYIDAETEEIVKKVSRKFNVDVQGTAATLYNGTQEIICYEYNNVYFLKDSTRNLITYDASTSKEIDYESCIDIASLSQEIAAVINSCSLISSNSPSFTSTYDMLLKSVTLDVVVQDSSWYSHGEGEANVYIKVKNALGDVVYTSGYYNNPSFPVTFTLSDELVLSTTDYVIEFWNYDPIGDDDYIGSTIIANLLGCDYTYPFTSTDSLVVGSYKVNHYGVQPAFDAHWGMEQTIDFYKEFFNRNSYDGNGAVVYNLVNINRDDLLLADFPTQACAIKIAPYYPMAYGMGAVLPNVPKRSMYPIVALDVMAHEYTHLVTELNGNGGLKYIGESGALNESFSDIMGVTVEYYAKGTVDWLIGEDLMVYYSNMRSMKQPKNGMDGDEAQPDTYQGKFWLDPAQTDCDTCDHGGVHTNSGVQNYWYYLLSEGGSGTNDNGDKYSVTGIGIDKAVQIAYRNLIYYLTPNATFADARKGSLQAATDLYGVNSKEYKAVNDAWYAVGVKENNPVQEIKISAKMPTNWGNTISAWVWEDGKEGQWATLVKQGQWWNYTQKTDKLNIVFVNGTTWNDDNNQSVDITLTESACIQLSNNTSGKRTYTIIDCNDSKTGLAIPTEDTLAQPQKIFENGAIYILMSDGRKYDIWGREIK